MQKAKILVKQGGRKTAEGKGLGVFPDTGKGKERINNRNFYICY